MMAHIDMISIIFQVSFLPWQCNLHSKTQIRYGSDHLRGRVSRLCQQRWSSKACPLLSHIDKIDEGSAQTKALHQQCHQFGHSLLSLILMNSAKSSQLDPRRRITCLYCLSVNLVGKKAEE